MKESLLNGSWINEKNSAYICRKPIDENEVSLTFRLPTYLLRHRLPKGEWLPPALDLVFGSRYCVV